MGNTSTNADSAANASAAASQQPPVLRYLRQHLRGFEPYKSARSLYTEGIFLDANENPSALYGPDGQHWNRYPDGANRELRTALGALQGLPPEQVFAGNGSDEVIDLLVRAFCEPGREAILTCPPTYGVYGIAARFHGAGIYTVPLGADFQLDVPAVVGAAQDAAIKLVFLCSPNNPTGNLLRNADIEAVLRATDKPVVLDEAYVDFTDQAAYWPQRLDEYPNLLLSRTLSKAWALAGVRLGYAYAQPALIALLQGVKPPYNLSRLANRAALDALRRPDAMQASVRQLRTAATEMATALAQLPTVAVYPTDANFILIRVPDAAALHAHLAHQKLITRNQSYQHGLANTLRISVGSAAENQLLLQQIRKFLS